MTLPGLRIRYAGRGPEVPAGDAGDVLTSDGQGYSPQPLPPYPVVPSLPSWEYVGIAQGSSGANTAGVDFSALPLEQGDVLYVHFLGSPATLDPTEGWHDTSGGPGITVSGGGIIRAWGTGYNDNGGVYTFATPVAGSACGVAIRGCALVDNGGSGLDPNFYAGSYNSIVAGLIQGPAALKQGPTSSLTLWSLVSAVASVTWGDQSATNTNGATTQDTGGASATVLRDPAPAGFAGTAAKQTVAGARTSSYAFYTTALSAIANTIVRPWFVDGDVLTEMHCAGVSLIPVT